MFDTTYDQCNITDPLKCCYWDLCISKSQNIFDCGKNVRKNVCSINKLFSLLCHLSFPHISN